MELVSIKSRSKKRVGRGLSAGGGKTAGRGTKGQKSRSGYNIPNKFEGGQTPITMRLAKLPGFRSVNAKATIVSLDQISKAFKAGEEVTIKALVEKNIVNPETKKVKVLNNGTLTVAVKFGSDVKVSKSVVIPAAKADSDVIPAKAGIQAEKKAAPKAKKAETKE